MNKIRPYYNGSAPGQTRKASKATESVLNALVLVSRDKARNGGTLGEAARRSLAIMWTTQEEDGSWDWLNFGLRPWEKEATYLGTAWAAVAVGRAGLAYSEESLTPEEKQKLDRMIAYLKAKYPSESLHNRLAALWASAYFPEGSILSTEQRQAIVEEILNLDPDGDAWAVTSLSRTPAGGASWTAGNRIPADTESDGYSTALILFVLKQANLAQDSPRVAKAKAWLIEKEVAEGKGPVIYLNTPRNPDSSNADQAMVGKFMRDAAAAYAVMVLDSGD
jgi:hypothetical protein